MPGHLIILGERDAIAWVVSKQRMAFAPHRVREVSALLPGDGLFLYATRGAFHNPTRDRGRIFGRARATTAPAPLPEPVEISGMSFSHGIELELIGLTSPRSGVHLANLVPRLSTFANKSGWGMMLRRPLLTLNPGDVALLDEELQPLLRPQEEMVDAYLAEAKHPLPAA